MRSVLFSDAFNIDRTDKDDWFDPILDADTELFVDPFLIFKEGEGLWVGAHDHLIAHFDRIFGWIAKSGGLEKSPYYKRALDKLKFREPSEFCLGYTARGVKGAGGGLGVARQIAKAMASAIKRGIDHLDHFELLGIFNEGIGPDRIGDLTCTILKHKFIEYTVAVAKKHGIPTQTHTLKRAGIGDDGEWLEVTAELPTNPKTGDPILLVPVRFLRRLPTLNADDWWDHFNTATKLNITVMENVDKAKIVAEALRNRKDVEDWAKKKAKGPGTPYDLDKDPYLVWQWEPISRFFTLNNPIKLTAAKKKSEFFDVIDKVCAQYKLFIEQEAGWESLWNDDGSEKHERAAQNLFRGIAKHYCHANGIVIDREVDLGRGPVDFKFSKGTAFTAHLEVKKLENGRFWLGLSTQLPIYMRSDGVEDGWLLGVRLRDGGVSKTRARELPAAVKKTSDAEKLNLRYALVDGRPKPSASKAPGRNTP